MRIRHYIQLISVNLIPKLKEIEQNPPKISGFKISRMEYLISLILTHKQDNHAGAWSVLYMPFLQRIVPKAGQYLKFMKSEGIIEWKNYSSGRNSRLYRLKNEGRTEYRTIIDNNLTNRIDRNYRNLRQRNSKKHPKLNEYINKVKINTDLALKTVETKFFEDLVNDPNKAESHRTFSLAEIEKINSGYIFIKCNLTNGRLDSNVTRLPRELVPHLTINGNPLIEIDIKNSQPFFAATIINPTLEVEKLMERFLDRSLTMLLKSLKMSECEDVKLYKSLVANGTFYEPFMMTKLKEAGIEFSNREELKRRLFIVFFGKKNAWKYDQVARVFKSIFPNVLTYFDTVKGDYHNRLAIFLQRLESYIILEKVTPVVIQRLPNVPFVTKHDSLLPSGLMVTDNAGNVQSIMLEVITEVTGLTPQVRVKGIEKSKVRRRKQQPSINQLSLQLF